MPHGEFKWEMSGKYCKLLSKEEQKWKKKFCTQSYVT